MKKYILDLLLRRTSELQPGYVLLQLTDPDRPLPPMQPGQFVEVRVDDSPSTFLRRPISIHYVDRAANELWLLVRVVGDGTRALAALSEGATVNVVLPLGRGFDLTLPGDKVLVGGGVGVAPLLFLGSELVRLGHRPTFLLGGRTAADLVQLDHFRRYGDVYLTTEDGSVGERGFVTQHSLWQTLTPQLSTLNSHPSPLTSHPSPLNYIYTCGPKPMMQAVARLAREHNIPCEVSLENQMACGLGACLCCVEDTIDGHRCVCTDGPVFNIDELKW